uniref:Terminase n=1 Tax=viral metagenome TaxID=1070528 RepID=A0A6M3IPR0_9ZZZZ
MVKPLGRPIGSTGTFYPKFNFEEAFRFSSRRTTELKRQCIDLIESEQCDNLSQCGDRLDVPKLVLHRWYMNDKSFSTMVDQAQQIKADRLEEKIDKINNPVAMIFRLKKLRPEYRDNYRIDVTSEKLEDLLEELKRVGDPPKAPRLPVVTITEGNHDGDHAADAKSKVP